MLVLLASLFIAALGSGGGVDCSSGSVVSAHSASSARRHLTCDDAEQDCIGRLTCGMAFHGHRLDCRRELAGRTPGRCSVHCRQSLVSLASTEEGYAYIGCECGPDDFCRALRLRLAPCWWQKPCVSGASNATAGFQIPSGLTLIASSSSTSSARPQCSQLAQDCVSDPVCSVAWDYYRRFCHEVLEGVAENCPNRCRNSVRVLLQMEKAHRLLDCACDGRVTRVTCGNELNRIRRRCFRMDGIGPSSGGGQPSFDGVLALAVLVVVRLVTRWCAW
ncbi:hypothetical protein V5799_021143 [Amblyomma americanum]|uniref:Growth arrest-specific protein 1 n=1 Tax=Amblyomma americanum TaxID=6943 RepID=A0AAQ4FP29_AMBAM